MRAVLVKEVPEKGTVVKEVEITNYKDYYKYMECDLFDVVMVQWDGYPISIYIDDEGMLKPNLGRMVQGYPEPLFGAMVICGGVDSEGNTLDLPDFFSRFDIPKYITPPLFRIE